MTRRTFQVYESNDDCGIQVINRLNAAARDRTNSVRDLCCALGLIRDNWKTSEIGRKVRDLMLTALFNAEFAADAQPFGAIDADLRDDAFQAARLLIVTWATPISERPALPRCEFEDAATWPVQQLYERLCVLDLVMIRTIKRRRGQQFCFPVVASW